MHHVRPLDLHEALEILSVPEAHSAPLAGGTDLMVQMARRQVQPATLVCLDALGELRGISLGATTRIGALVTHQRIANESVLLDEYPDLCNAADFVGGWQTKAVGTIGGNICNASPAADLPPSLLVHGAQIELQSRARGIRVIRLEEFLLGRRQTARKEDELVTAIMLERRPEATGCAYRKVGRRSAMEVAVAGLAVRVTVGRPGRTLTDVRIATCAVGPVTKRARAAEALLQNAQYDAERIAAAGAALIADSAPIDDARATRQYRLAVLPRLLDDVLRVAVDRATASVAMEQ
jgi:carbon-monoxide dehydrogenase medium subunit